MAINQLNKYVWLVETIHWAKKRGGITLKEIQSRWSDSALSEGTELSRRTFINNIHSIEELFEINIECGSAYRYNIEYGDCFDEGSTRSWMLNAFSLHAMVGNSRKLKERVLLEDMPSGRNYLEDIIKAMRDSHKIPKPVITNRHNIPKAKDLWEAMIIRRPLSRKDNPQYQRMQKIGE